MPNWCSTSYCFFGDKNEIQDFYCKLEKLTSEERIKNGFGNNWLGNVVDGFGFDWHTVKCRGSISDISDIEEPDSTYFYVDTETAWEPCASMWDMILEKFYPTIRYVLLAEEPGSELYINTDTEGTYFIDRFKVDMYVPKKELDVVFYASSEWEMVHFLNSVLGRKYKSLKQCKKCLKEECRKKNKGVRKYYFNIYRFDSAL